MAFPTIPTTGNGRLLSQNQNNATSPRTFPSLSSLTKNAGDLLLAIVVAYERGAAGATFSSWGASFTERADIDGGATLPAFGIASKVSDGTETGTFTVAQASVVGHCSLFLLSIAGGGPITIDWTTTVATGTGSAADPASLNPANWGTEDTLWIAVAMNGETSTTGSWTGLGTPTAPTNYSSANSPGIGTDAVGGIHSAVAFRQNNTAAEDVGTWGGQDTTQARNAAILIAVRPVLVPTGLGKSIFVGSGPEIWNHSPGVSYEKAGLGRMGVRSNQVAGYGTLVLSASGVDAATWADTGSGILARVASGVAVKTTGAVEKTGAGIVSDLKGAASDAVTWTKSGSGVLVSSVSASDAVTFTEIGSAVLVRTASATDEATFVEAGSGILARSASGVRESVTGTTYTKTGFGRMGADITGATSTKAGAGVAGLSASGVDEATFTEAGSGVLNAVGSGVAVRQGSSEKTGAGIRGHVGAGSDAASFVETGAGILSAAGSGTDAATFGETGAGILTGVASGASAVAGGVTYTKQAIGIMGRRLGGGAAGTGISGFVGSGVAVEVAGALDKTGAGVRGMVASGTKAGIFNRTGKLTRYEFTEPPSLDDDYPPSLTMVASGVAVEVAGPATYTKTGSATRGMVGSGSDAVTFTEAGAGILNRTGGGASSRGAETEKTGTATSAHTASGADAVTFTKTAAGILNRTATGSDTAQFTKTGAGVLDRYGSGAKIKMGEFVKFGSATAVFVASGTVETDLDRPPPGFITQTNTGRITRLRVGRITHSREGVVV